MKIVFNNKYLAMLAAFAAKQDVRYYLNGFHVKPHPEKGVILTATDGHTLKPLWQMPETTPTVPVGEEQEFWIAVHSPHTNKTHVYLAQYQNRPVNLDEDGEPIDDEELLIDVDGEYVDSVGWVMSRQHSEFDNYYEKIDFNSDYQLLGWAVYQPPAFDGVVIEGGAA